VCCFQLSYLGAVPGAASGVAAAPSVGGAGASVFASAAVSAVSVTVFSSTAGAGGAGGGGVTAVVAGCAAASVLPSSLPAPQPTINKASAAIPKCFIVNIFHLVKIKNDLK
jgi:hypothetical protein